MKKQILFSAILLVLGAYGLFPMQFKVEIAQLTWKVPLFITLYGFSGLLLSTQFYKIRWSVIGVGTGLGLLIRLCIDIGQAGVRNDYTIQNLISYVILSYLVTCLFANLAKPNSD